MNKKLEIQNIFNNKYVLTVLVVGVLLNMLPEKLLAAEWSMKPVVVVGYAYNDNLQMKVIPDNSVSITTIKPILDFGHRREQKSI